MVALTMSLLGLHLSGTTLMAQESGLSASHHGSHHMAMVTEPSTPSQTGEHTSMEAASGQGKCCAVMDHCGLSCPAMVFNGEDGVSFQPFFPTLQTPLHATRVEGQIPPPLFRPPITFS